MKPSSVVYTTALLWGISVSTAASMLPATAITFEQKELDQNRVVAIAVPLAQGDRYNLLILEQLSNRKQCWEQNPNNPSTIDPLLLKFDFTNICGRSTDSNGYSVRIAGQDKALDYRLSINRTADHLVLLAIPSRNPQEPTLEIARTETLAPGFLKLQLNPEWRFTKRTYGGKTLGHIYLTRDTPAGTNYSAGGQSGIDVNPSPYRPKRPLQTQRRSPYGGGTLAPITAPIQIPVPPPSTALRLRQPSTLSRSRWPDSPLPPTEPLPNVAAGILPVPTSSIPMGNAGNEPDLITASTPSLNLNTMAPLGGGTGRSSFGAGIDSRATTNTPFQMAMVNFRYRVFVNAVDQNEQKAVKTLVPDSFRSSYQGRPMLQVGAFQDRAKADEMVDLLNRNGINSILAAE